MLGTSVGPRPNIIMLKIVMTHNLFAQLLIFLYAFFLEHIFVFVFWVCLSFALHAGVYFLSFLAAKVPGPTAGARVKLCTYFARIMFLLYYLCQDSAPSFPP